MRLFEGGTFSLDQSISGKIAEFNIWNQEMSVEELNSQTCGVSGNVASWNTLQERGKSARAYRKFPTCNGK